MHVPVFKTYKTGNSNDMVLFWSRASLSMQTPNSCSLHGSVNGPDRVGHTDFYFPNPFPPLLVLLVLFIAGPGRHKKRNDNFKVQGSEACFSGMGNRNYLWCFVPLRNSLAQRRLVVFMNSVMNSPWVSQFTFWLLLQRPCLVMDSSLNKLPCTIFSYSAQLSLPMLLKQNNTGVCWESRETGMILRREQF